MNINDEKLKLDILTALKYDNDDLANKVLSELVKKIEFALANGNVSPYEFGIGYIYVIDDLIKDKKELIKSFEMAINVIKIKNNIKGD